MKKSRSILLILLSAVFALCVFAFTACTPGDGGSEGGEVKITIAPTTLSLTVGGAVGNIEATVENSEETVTWSCNKPAIATVTADAENGNKAVVTAVAAGDAVITAKIGDTTSTCRVTVTGGSGGQEQTVNVALDRAYLTLTAGGATGEVNATVTGSTEKVTWTVNKPEVASIAANGNKVTVTPVAAGTAKLTATLGDITRECTVTVAKAPITITLSETVLDLTKGADAVEVTATLANAEAGDTVQWLLATGGDEVVTITPDGNKVSVLPIGVGKTTLTAKLGEVTEEVEITVVKAPVSLTLDKEKVELNDETTSVDVIATVENSEEEVVWTIGGNNNIATIVVDDEDSCKCTVTAVATGKTTLTATVEGKSVSIPVLVTGENGTVKIELDITELKLEKGDDAEINATLIGSLDNISWVSGDPDVVTVSANEDGTKVAVNAVGAGAATITATVGETEVTVDVTVTEVLELTVTINESEVADGDRINLIHDGEHNTATIVATTNIDSIKASWTKSDEDGILSITDTDGTLSITANNYGFATVTATATNIKGEQFTVTINVYVYQVLGVSLDEETLTLEVENATTGEATLTATSTGIAPSELVWVASKEGVVTLLDNDDGTCTITAVAAGTVTITVKAIRGDEEVTASCEITVTESKAPTVITNWETVADAIYGEVNDGGVDKLYHHVYFRDENLTITDYEVTAKVNGEAATLGENHMDAGAATGKNFHFHIQLVNATRYDDVELKFVFKNGSAVVATGTYTRAGIKEIVLNLETLKIQVGTNGEVTATVNGNIADKTVTWSIADGTVASLPDTVTGNSITVTGVAEGNTVLTATVGEGDSAITATCAIEVSEDEVLPPQDVDVTAGITKQFVYNDIFLQVEWTLTGIDGFNVSDVKKYEISAVKDDEPYTVDIQNRMGASDANVIGTGVQINIHSAPSGNTLTITINFIDGADNVIGHATIKVDPPTNISIPSTASIELGEDNAAVTYEVEVTGAGAAKDELANVTWTLTGGEGYVTIPEDATGAKVTLNATAATTEDVMITLTATLMIGEKKYESSCKVTVFAKGEKKGEELTASYARKYGDNYVVFTLNKPLTYGTDFGYYKVNGVKNDVQHYVADPAPTYQFYVGADNYAAGSKVKIEFCTTNGDGEEEVVYWFECEVGA